MMATERIATRLLEELAEQSEDLNSDALRITRGALTDFGQANEPAPRHWWRRRGALAGVAGAAAVLGAYRAFAATATASALAAHVRGVNDLYVALTRATRSLGVIHSRDLPKMLEGLVPR
ncbi:hypothetical protein ACFC1R_33405 [Kitasatospora sp. NPDC056138]|uniref:hypothetical protein n=1 Tax=Kitasatospora sp. NPDC056138 TaxID=3345724 RepID=UPI0035D7DAA6